MFVYNNRNNEIEKIVLTIMFFNTVSSSVCAGFSLFPWANNAVVFLSYLLCYNSLAKASTNIIKKKRFFFIFFCLLHTYICTYIDKQRGGHQEFFNISLNICLKGEFHLQQKKKRKKRHTIFLFLF